MRGAEICVGLIAHGKMQKLRFCGMGPQVGDAAKDGNDQIGEKNINTIRIDLSDDFVMSWNWRLAEMHRKQHGFSLDWFAGRGFYLSFVRKNLRV